MSLLHATWLPLQRSQSSMDSPALFLWADKWRVAKPIAFSNKPQKHPFTLSNEDLCTWLTTKNLLPKEFKNIYAYLNLPSKEIKSGLKSQPISTKATNHNNLNAQLTYLPLQAEEPIPKTYLWWPWKVEGLAISPIHASSWFAKLPLSNCDRELGEELLWWSHLERWSLSLIARGLWLPKVECNENLENYARAKWVPLLNHENERRRLEEFSCKLPLVATCAQFRKEIFRTHPNKNEKKDLEHIRLESSRPISNRIQVANLLEELIDAQLRQEFQSNSHDLDPLLNAWQDALGSQNGLINLGEEDCKRLIKASQNWKEGISGNVKAARACFELIAPTKGTEDWELQFLIQAEADPALKINAETIWSTRVKQFRLGEIQIENPVEILLEGLGRALTIFQPLERALENATPEKMHLSSIEAFILIRTATKKLRDVGIGVILPSSLSEGLANRLGLTIKAELSNKARGLKLGETLEWSWDLMIGGITLNLKELEVLEKKQSPLVNHKGSWIELRPNDLKNAANFCASQKNLSLDDALRLTAVEGSTLMKMPIHHFDAGPKLQQVLEQYHQHKAPEPLSAPEGFRGQLRPYQEQGLGWLTFLHRFNQGACLADDMGLGKTIQLLAFIQHLKINKDLKKPILLIAPTSVLTNWKREAIAFTPELSLIEHYGPQRASTTKELVDSLENSDILMTSYGLMYRDVELLKTIEWQGIIIDEAQAIKNPSSKQSQSIREIAKHGKSIPFRVALTGTPVENRVSEIWSLMNFLNPLVLGEENFFDQRYKLPIERYGDISSLTDLKARVSPFILRRLKSDKSIISDLPKKIELNEWVGLSHEQKNLYNKTVDDVLLQISQAPLGKRHGKTLGLLTRLKQICNHPALALKEEHVDTNFASRSAKVQRLDEIFEEILLSKDRALLFTQFAEWGHLLKAYLQKKWGVEIPFLHGSTRKIERQQMIDWFQEDPRGPQLFLLSLKAGGVGLNLTRANHVFHIDRWWNPAVENQATDRAYRIGQTNRVMVHKFITTGSVEEKINQMIFQKAKLAENIIGSSEDWLGKLKIEELRSIVSLKQDQENND